MRFHDGQPLDAAAVRFSFERAKAPNSGNKSRSKLFDNIERIETPDLFTVVLTLRHRDPHLLYRLGRSPAVILHPASVAQASPRSAPALSGSNAGTRGTRSPW